MIRPTLDFHQHLLDLDAASVDLSDVDPFRPLVNQEKIKEISRDFADNHITRTLIQVSKSHCNLSR
jgi:hypothetical protein